MERARLLTRTWEYHPAGRGVGDDRRGYTSTGTGWEARWPAGMCTLRPATLGETW